MYPVQGRPARSGWLANSHLADRVRPSTKTGPGPHAMTLALAILPIALAFLAGWTAKAVGLLKPEHWTGIELLSFRILIPAILIRSIATADLTSDRIGPMAAALVSLVVLAGLMALSVRFFISKERLSGPSLSTLFQTTTRWNAFISLSAAELLGGPEVLLLIAVSMSVLIPLINVSNILVLAWLCAGTTGPRRVLRAVVSNPLVIGCAIGLALNAAPFDLPAPIFETLDIIGRAALGIGLLVVGAGISGARLRRISGPVLIGALMRPISVPLVFLGLAQIFQLTPEETLAGLLVAAVPAATNGYVVARSMGGDTELYADIMIYQTFLSMLAIPLYASLIL